ncbi:MAG: amino acid--tRNA ligase-related protein [Caldilineaceae bacterium]
MAYLAQSPQFYKQIMVGVFERVYEVGPVFRAEPHDTVRHVNEYVSLDVEFGFIENHFTVMAMLREVIHGIMDGLARYCPDELALLNAAMPSVPQTIPHIHFHEAQELIFQKHGVDVRGEPDLSPQDERWLGAWAQEEFNSDFLFVVGYPMGKRPFTPPSPADPTYANSFDLLFRGTELVTGGQRLHRYEDYLSALARAGHPTEPFATYLEAFRYGMPPPAASPSDWNGCSCSCWGCRICAWRRSSAGSGAVDALMGCRIDVVEMGRCTSTDVPCPGALSMVTAPPCLAIRSRME